MDLSAVVDLKHLQAFVLVAEEQHFGRAAERAFVSTSTMSGRIKDLEQALGYRVFERTSRRVELTNEGAQLLEPVQSGLAELQRGFELGGAPDSVRVISTPEVQPTSILSAMQRICGENVPQIGYGFQLGQALIDDRADLAVTWSSPAELQLADELLGVQIGEVEAFAIFAADDPLAADEVISASMLSDRDAVLFERRMAPGPLDRFLRLLGRDEDSVLTKAVHSQAGMAAKMLENPGSFTFGSSAFLPPTMKAMRLEPPLMTSYWALARPGDQSIIDRFLTFIDEY